MTNLRHALRAFHADVHKYLFAVSIVGFSYFGFVSVLLNLYLLRLGYGTDFIGVVNGSIAFAFAASSLPAGALGSRLGMRRTAGDRDGPADGGDDAGAGGRFLAVGWGARRGHHRHAHPCRAWGSPSTW